MGALAVKPLRKIAVMAEHLEARRKSVTSEPTVEVGARGGSQLRSMLVTSAIDVIDTEKFICGLLATSTRRGVASIVPKKLLPLDPLAVYSLKVLALFTPGAQKNLAACALNPIEVTLICWFVFFALWACFEPIYTSFGSFPRCPHLV
jgi:hypothetical protein